MSQDVTHHQNRARDTASACDGILKVNLDAFNPEEAYRIISPGHEHFCLTRKIGAIKIEEIFGEFYVRLRLKT